MRCVCGIAGFSLGSSSGLDPTALARALAAGIAERGRDATGWAWRAGREPVEVRKLDAPAHEVVHAIELPAHARLAIVHVREYTKGLPAVVENNHPVQWGRITLVHNGHLENDDELFERYGQPRSTPRITVDTEAIAMLSDVLDDPGRALEEVRGSAAIAVLDERRPDVLVLARRARRPLVIAHGDGVLLFASTREALLPIVEAAGLEPTFEALQDGELCEVEDGMPTVRRRFRVLGFRGRPVPIYPANPYRAGLVEEALAGLAQASAPARSATRNERASSTSSSSGTGGSAARIAAP